MEQAYRWIKNDKYPVSKSALVFGVLRTLKFPTESFNLDSPTHRVSKFVQEKCVPSSKSACVVVIVKELRAYEVLNVVTKRAEHLRTLCKRFQI